jgi:hypothetical protein
MERIAGALLFSSSAASLLKHNKMYITNWDEFQTAVEDLYTASPELVSEL